jgi:hypothetical protein
MRPLLTICFLGNQETASSMSQESPLEVLGPQAFDVFCAVTAKDAAFKNNQLEEETTQLLPIFQRVISFEIEKGFGDEKSTIFSGSLIHYSEEHEAYYSYSAIDTTSTGNPMEFPYDDIKSIFWRISGVDLNLGAGLAIQPPIVKVCYDTNTVDIQMSYTENITIQGKIQDYQGTIQDIQRMIEGNRIEIFFSFMDVQAGGPPLFPFLNFGQNFLEGSKVVEYRSTLDDHRRSPQRRALTESRSR